MNSVNKEKQLKIEDFVCFLEGKKCWYVSCGGSVGPTFSLALGRKIPRKRILKNKAHALVYRKYEGECNLLVWCTWRLDSINKPLTSSDDGDDRIKSMLAKLIGKKVVDLRVDKPGLDIILSFTGGLTLNMFCDHLPGNPSIDSNWELWLKDQVMCVGPGSFYEIRKRDPRSS